MKQRKEVKVHAYDHTWKVAGTFYPGRASQTSGPPEKCYEEEPSEFDIDKVWLDGVATPVTTLLMQSVLEDIAARACEVCLSVRNEQM